MSYTKAIVIQYQRTVNIGVADEKIPNSGFLSDLDLNSINEIIIELNEVISNPNGALIWGQEQIMIDSGQINSKCVDQINNTILPDIPTISFLNLMIENKKFKEQYQNSINLKNIIEQAFTNIKSNPNNYKRWSNSNSDFSTTINNVFISLVLKPKDFNLSKSEYVNQLRINF